MKKIFKTTAMLLGWSTCIASGKCPQDAELPSIQPDADQTEDATPQPNALALFQDLDKIYYL